MKIGVIGLGVVGAAVKHGLERIGHEVVGHDLKLGTSIGTVADTAVTFVCVPTPSARDGSCDISRVAGVVGELAAIDYRGLITIKSTVAPGTTDALASTFSELQFAFCPEFLRERAAYVDFVENHDLLVTGAHADAHHELLAAAHGALPKHVARMRPVEAEIAKYFSNVFNALRVVFANGFYEVAQRLGADYDVIKRAMVHRTGIEDVYLDCNERFRGFGGVCLPKDTAAFAELAKRLGLDLRLFQTIVEDNKRFVTTVPDGMRES